jgi:hypothetical protein
VRTRTRQGWNNLAMALSDEENPAVGSDANSREVVRACQKAIALLPDGVPNAKEELERAIYRTFIDEEAASEGGRVAEL